MIDKNYIGKCGNCYWMEEYKNNKIYCYYYKHYYWKSETCSHYKSGYVTTAVCNVLGKNNCLDTLQKIKELRIMMDNDPDFERILDRYDRVGPIIAKSILEDYRKNKDNSLAQNLYDFYIKPTTKLYEEGKVFEAIEKYSTMEDILEDCFHLKTTDYTNIGETRLIKLKKSKL